MDSSIKMTLECKFCNKTFSSVSSLNYHQKTAKYCLKIQQKTDEEVIKISFDCEYCKKEYPSKQRLKAHKENCLEKYKKIIKDQNDEMENKDKNYKIVINQKDFKIKELEDEIENYKQQMKTIRLEVENEFYKQREERSTTVVEQIAKQPRVQTNNNQKVLITSPLDMSQPAVMQAIQNGFSEDYLVQGQKGAARFAYDNMLKDEKGKLKYVCTDASRQIFQYKDDNGTIQKDVRATKLTKALLDGDIKQASHKIACSKMDGSDEAFEAYTNNYYEIKDLESDNSEFSKELSTLTV